MDKLMNIGEAAEAVGVSTKMIRHYEQIGLLPEATRTDSGYRQYSERDLSVLRFIRQSRRLGFSMRQIADLIGLWANTDRTSREVKRLAGQHLADLAEKMRELSEMKQGLESLVAACHGDDDPHCAILEQLAVDSPAQPTHHVHAKPSTRPRTAKREPKDAIPTASAGSHIDLMAWTRNIRV
jgi:Cu(I)-responsive transcriptional regulator